MPAAMASLGERTRSGSPSSSTSPDSARLQAEQHAHQRALAGAVLAEEGVHLPGVDVEVDVVVGDDAGEPRRDAAHLQQRCRRRRHDVISRSSTPELRSPPELRYQQALRCRRCLRALSRRGALCRRRRRRRSGSNAGFQLATGERGDRLLGSRHDLRRNLVVGVELDHQAFVGEVDVVVLAAERPALDAVDEIGEDDLPVVHLVGDDDLGGELGLVALRAEPQHAALVGHADRPDRHLRRSGQDRGPAIDERRRRLGGEGHVTERVGVVDADLDARTCGFGAGDEAIHVQLGVADLDRSDHSDRAVAGEQRRPSCPSRSRPDRTTPSTPRRWAARTCRTPCPRRTPTSGKSGAISESGPPYCEPWAITRSYSPDSA